jgi:NitT/TauT family transport system permease protein
MAEPTRKPAGPIGRLPLLAAQVAVLAGLLAIWHLGGRWGFLDPFFFATPEDVIARTWTDLGHAEIYRHLWVTTIETLLAFAIGTVGGIALGFWLGLSPIASLILDPYVKAANALPRVVLAPIFALWLGLGIWSKVALGFSLVFFIVFFNVYQGIKEVSPVVLANARMLGASRRQLMVSVYLPSALSWVFSSLHTAVGFALVGAVVGEYLGSAAGLGYRIHQAEGVFDTVGVFSGMLILTIFVIAVDAVVSQVEARFLVWRPDASGRPDAA